jgi:hypothetical protein
MKGAMARIRELREANGRSGQPFTIGAFGPPGPPEKVAASIPYFEDLGVDQVQVRFPSSSCADLVDQIERFSALVTQPG